MTLTHTEPVILSNIRFDPDVEALAARLHVRDGNHHREELLGLVDEARPIARPKVLFKSAFIEDRDDSATVIDGVRFTSRVLRVNLDVAFRVFPYVATCGTELADWASSKQDMLTRFWADAICEAALRIASQALRDHLDGRYRPGKLSSMNPGSLPDWPIDQQRPLFAILGDTHSTVGVRLTESLLMSPIKSVSGILFPTETTFESCQLCPREGCPGRRAPHDPELHARKYSQSA